MEATMVKGRKSAKSPEEKRGQPNAWGHFRAAAPVELGQGGVKFARRVNGRTYALPCSPENSTVTATEISYAILCIELPQFCAYVKASGGQISGAELYEQFQDSPLAYVSDETDWDGWVESFSPENSQRGRPKGAALTFLERKMSIDRGTIKSYLSRAKKHPNERK
jgi:hypothetical protein